MLQSISSPRGEAASPPSPRCSDAKKAVTLKCLAVTLKCLAVTLKCLAVTLKCLAVTPRIQQFNWVTWPRGLILGLKGRFGQ
jgi:hypothetical protein